MRALIALVSVLTACSDVELTTETAEVVAKKKTTTVTKIRVNGLSSDAILSDPNTGTNGFINVARDKTNDTTALDFSYVTPTTDPDFVTLVQGAGEIPNTAYTRTNNTAHLVLAATPFPITQCTVNVVTAEFTCSEGNPIAFDLFWEQNGYSEIEEKIRRTEKIGPLTIRFNGEFAQRSALVTGFWNGNTADNMNGNLLDTQNSTVIREITMQAN